MKKLFSIVLIVVCLVSVAAAQDSTPKLTVSKFMQITTIESVVGGGIGRSKMIISKDDGTQEERELENLFSLAGINFKNIRENENNILRTLKSFTDAGWKLTVTVPLTLSPMQGGNGIFMTRYLLSMDVPK